MKNSVAEKVFGGDICACNGFATLEIGNWADSVTLVHVAGELGGRVDSGSDIGQVPIIATLERQFVVEYGDDGATEDLVEWAEVQTGGCAVELREGDNAIILATPGTYRLRFNAPDMAQCLQVYMERVTNKAAMVRSSLRFI